MKRKIINKGLITVLIVSLLGGTAAIGCSKINTIKGTNSSKQTTNKNEVPATEQKASSKSIDDYPDKMTEKLDAFPLFEKAITDTKLGGFDLYGTRNGGDFLAKVKKINFSSKGAEITMIIKNTSSSALTIKTSDVFVTEKREKSNFFATMTIGVNQTIETTFTVPKSLQIYVWGEYVYCLVMKGAEFRLSENDTQEKITDAKPVEKYMEAGPVEEELKHGTVMKNFIIGNKQAKMLCNGVDIIDNFKDGRIADKQLFLGYAEMTMANTSNKDITISAKDIELQLDLGEGYTEYRPLSEDKELPSFKTITVKPAQIVTFKVPVIIGPDEWTRMDITINNTKFVYSRLENMQK